jgi:hypothetical protein
LNDDDLPAIFGLEEDLLLTVAAKSAGGVGLLAQALDRIHDRALVGLEGLSDGGVIIDILRHHVEHLGKADQRQECGIKPLGLRRIGQSCALEARILVQPVLNVENLLRVGGGGGDLRQQGVGIEGNRREQLIEFLRSGKRRLRVQEGRGHAAQ